jgi:hypothetical protein
MYEILIVDDEDVVDLFSQMFSSEVRSGQYRCILPSVANRGLKCFTPSQELTWSSVISK